MPNPLQEKNNQDQFWMVVQSLDPQLYNVKIALQETGLDPAILIPVIRSLANLSFGTGFGKLQIFMTNHVVTQIQGEERVEINKTTLLERNPKA